MSVTNVAKQRMPEANLFEECFAKVKDDHRSRMRFNKFQPVRMSTHSILLEEYD